MAIGIYQISFWRFKALEILNFLKQAGFALAGASALWGWIFSRGKKDEIATKLLPLFFGGLIIGTISWLIIFWREAGSVLAHEGISIYPSLNASISAKFIQTPILLAAITIALLVLFKKNSNIPFGNSTTRWFFPMEFFLMSATISLLGWVGEINREQIFFFAHGFHSILTLGTVLTVDYLFFVSRRDLFQKQAIYPAFPFMSKVIWLGLGIDFASVALIFEEALNLTTKFYFTQTVIGILIINGVFLSGPMTRRLLDSVKRGITNLPKRLNFVAGISGSVSVISWVTINFLDQFQTINLTYGQFFLYYLIAIIAAFLVRTKIEDMAQPSSRSN